MHIKVVGQIKLLERNWKVYAMLWFVVVAFYKFVLSVLIINFSFKYPMSEKTYIIDCLLFSIWNVYMFHLKFSKTGDTSDKFETGRWLQKKIGKTNTFTLCLYWKLLKFYILVQCNFLIMLSETHNNNTAGKDYL